MTSSLDEVILNELPFFIAINYQKVLSTNSPKEKVKLVIYSYDLILRATAMALVSQYLTRDREHVNDTYLNELILQELPIGGVNTWQNLLFSTLRVYEGKQDLFFVKELYEFYWDTKQLPHKAKQDVELVFTRLTQIRNDLEHSDLIVNEKDWQRLSNDSSQLLREVMSNLSFFRNYNLIRIIEQQNNTYFYELHKGLHVTKNQMKASESKKLRQSWFYLSKQDYQDFLPLHPLLFIWENHNLSNLTSEIQPDTAIFERFIYTNLQYLMSLTGRKIESSEAGIYFIERIINVINQLKVAQTVEKLSWWKLRDLSNEISQQRMATVQEKYNPQLYLQRNKIKRVFNDFLHSDKKAFVLIGKSGVGKSNFLLSIDNEIRHERHDLCLLMYDAAIIDPEFSLTKLITLDFCDQLNISSSGDESIWSRINEIDNINNKKVLLLIDAINENSQGRSILAQINELIQKPYPWLKVVITSRPEAWINIKNGIKLAERLFYRESNSEKMAVEMEPFLYSKKLETFSTDELAEVYEKYQKFYELNTPYEKIPESIRELMREPLILWLITSSNQGESIPDKVKLSSVIPNYIQSMVETNRLDYSDLEFLQNELMPLMISKNRYSNSVTLRELNQVGSNLLEKVYVTNKLSDGRRVNQSFVNLVDSEILLKRGDFLNYEITFKYERFYDYFAGFRLNNIFQSLVRSEERYRLYLDLSSKIKSFPYLWGAVSWMILLDLQKNVKIAVLLSCSSDYYVRELITSSLTEFGQDFREEAEQVLLGLINEKYYRFIYKQHGFSENAFLGKVTALKVASKLEMEDIIVTALQDSNQQIRVLSMQHIFHILKLEKVNIIFNILDKLQTKAINSLYIPSFKIIEAYIIASLLILFNYFQNHEIIGRLQIRWQKVFNRLLLRNHTENNWFATKLSLLIQYVISSMTAFIVVSAIKKVEISGSAIVSLKDLNYSLKMSNAEVEEFKRVTQFIDRDYGSIQDIRHEIVRLARRRNILSLYAVTILVFSHLISEKNITLSIVEEALEASIAEIPPTPLSAGLLLSLEVYLRSNINNFDEQVWIIFDRYLNLLYQKSKCIIAGDSRRYFWANYNFYLYYYYSHISEKELAELNYFLEYLIHNKRWTDLQDVVIYGLSYDNYEHGINSSSVFKIISFLKNNEPLIRDAAISSLALLRSKYTAEIDEIIKEAKVPLELNIQIQNYQLNQSLGKTLTQSTLKFWTDAIKNYDQRFTQFLLWVVSYSTNCHSTQKLIQGIVDKVLSSIMGSNEQ